MSKVFLFRLRNSDDRDCCAYIDEDPCRFECGHYFGSVTLSGSCYIGKQWPAYEDIETVLTKRQYWRLAAFDTEIRNLGCGISPSDERYEKGMQLCDDIQDVYDVLNGNQAKCFCAYIKATEDVRMMEEYELDEEDIDYIFERYGYDYHDRSVIGCVYNNIDECARDEAWQLGLVRDGDGSDRYFDYEKFGEDLLEEEQYVELRDGRVVLLSL